ncbi:hypothetical protein EDB83DRAFT_2324362 [Lactarius deliciosus]|nr:hypothetical protein EDB83DRAFT_2324362 [Lactarius deliciosus]
MPPNPSHDGTTEGVPARAGQCDERSDGNQEDDELVFVNTGRYIKRCVHPFASISNILVIAQENLNPGSNPEGIRLLQTLLEQHGKVPRKVSEDLQLGMRTAQSSDAHTLKGLAGRLASTSQTPFNLSIDSKSDRGFNHDDLGRMLIPIDYLDAYNLDPADVVEKINDVNNEYNVTADLLPAFLYEDPDYYNPDNLLEGFMRGYFLVRCFRTIFIAAGSAMEEPSTTTKSVHAGLSKKYGMTTVTVPALVYTAIQANRPGFRSAPSKHGPAKKVLSTMTPLLRRSLDSSRWTKIGREKPSLGGTYIVHRHVFGHRNGLTSMGSTSGNTSNGTLARAKAQAAQRRIEEAAAYNEERLSSPLTQPSDEVPGDEEASSSFQHQTTPTTRGPEEIGDGGRLDEDSEGDVPARQSRKRSSRAHPEDEGTGDENDSDQELPGARRPQPRTAKKKSGKLYPIANTT